MTHYPVIIHKYPDAHYAYTVYSPDFLRTVGGDTVGECVKDMEATLQALVTWRLNHGLELPVPTKICDINSVTAYDVVYVTVDTVKSSDNGLVDTNLEDEL